MQKLLSSHKLHPPFRHPAQYFRDNVEIILQFVQPSNYHSLFIALLCRGYQVRKSMRKLPQLKRLDVCVYQEYLA